MEFISHTQTLASVLRANENRVKEDEPTLNTSLPIETVEHCYRQMANICLQLSELEMPRIGSLSERSNGSIEVATRPLSQSVNDLPHSAGCPREILPPVDQTYSSSYDWYCHLADKLVAQLVFQHNDAVESGDDCRDKFVARYLFRRLIRDRATSQTASASSESETFKFWCDDIRPNSVLLDNDLKVVGVIDWEWSYFVPASFASDPPWWLLLAKPEYDSDGFDSWVERYPAQLEIFLKMLEEEEKEPAQPKKASITEKLAKVNLQDSDTRPLSVRMRESWETGDFWINYAARKPYAFDPAFWKQIDVRFFGPNERGGYENRLSLLPEKVRRRMEWLAKQKMKEKEEYCLVEWKSGTATAYLRALLSAMD